MSTASMPLLWATCVERLKDTVNNRSFWESIEKTKPIVLDGDQLIIGFDVENFNYAGYLQQQSLQHTINTTISQIFNRPLTLRVIQGLTVDDWNQIKEQEARAVEARKAASTAPQNRAVFNANAGSWEALYDTLSRLYQEIPNRSLPQGRARYANEALYLLAQAMETLYPETRDEATERSLARMLDRISMMSEMPSGFIAFELERLRVYQKQAKEPS